MAKFFWVERELGMRLGIARAKWEVMNVRDISGNANPVWRRLVRNYLEDRLRLNFGSY